eukprot:CFRG5506T1
MSDACRNDGFDHFPTRKESIPRRRDSERMVRAFKNIAKQVEEESSNGENVTAENLNWAQLVKNRRSEIVKKRWQAVRSAVKAVSKWQSSGINPNLWYPMTKSYALWQAVMVCVTGYNMMVCPSILAFRELYLMPPQLLFINLAIDCLMCIHVRRNFKTAYVQLGVTYDTEYDISKHYKATGFTTDLIAALPLDTILFVIQFIFNMTMFEQQYWMNPSNLYTFFGLHNYSSDFPTLITEPRRTLPASLTFMGDSGLWDYFWFPAIGVSAVIHTFVLLIRCRALKLLTLPNLGSYCAGIANYTSHVNSVELIKLYLTVIWVGHLVGCGYYLICCYEEFEGSSFVFDKSFEDEALSTKLLMTFYWGFSSMSGVSSTAKPPETPVETIFSFFVSLISISIYAVIIGNMGKIIKAANHSSEKYRQAMERINNYMSYRKIPPAIQQRARQYFEFLHSRQRGYEDETILKDFPSHLRTEIYRHLCHDVVLKVPMFANSSKPFIDQMVSHLRPQIYSPGDFIVRIDEPGKEMYFISKGRVKVVNRVGASVVELGPGDFFGEIAVVSHSSRRVASVVANSFCDLFVLNKSNLDELLTEFPDDAHEISHVARQRLRSISTAHMKEAADSATAIYKRLFGEPPPDNIYRRLSYEGETCVNTPSLDNFTVYKCASLGDIAKSPQDSHTLDNTSEDLAKSSKPIDTSICEANTTRINRMNGSDTCKEEEYANTSDGRGPETTEEYLRNRVENRSLTLPTTLEENTDIHSNEMFGDRDENSSRSHSSLSLSPRLPHTPFNKRKLYSSYEYERSPTLFAAISSEQLNDAGSRISSPQRQPQSYGTKRLSISITNHDNKYSSDKNVVHSAREKYAQRNPRQIDVADTGSSALAKKDNALATAAIIDSTEFSRRTSTDRICVRNPRSSSLSPILRRSMNMSYNGHQLSRTFNTNDNSEQSDTEFSFESLNRSPSINTNIAKNSPVYRSRSLRPEDSGLLSQMDVERDVHHRVARSLTSHNVDLLKPPGLRKITRRQRLLNLEDNINRTKAEAGNLVNFLKALEMDDTEIGAAERDEALTILRRLTSNLLTSPEPSTCTPATSTPASNDSDIDHTTSINYAFQE